MSRRATYAELVDRGCTCGGERPAPCSIHKAGDNRGVLAYVEAGMPRAFPTEANCAICGADSLIYPNVEIDDPHGSGEFKRTLVCPRCSPPAAERQLRAEAERFHELNSKSVFGSTAGVAT